MDNFRRGSNIKIVCKHTLNSPAPHSWGVGFSFVHFYCKIIAWAIYYKTFLSIIMNISSTNFILVKLRLKTSPRWFIVGILLMAVHFLHALIVANWNSFLSAVNLVFVLPAETCTTRNVLFTCLVNWSTVFIDIVSSLFLKNCVFISLMTDLF